MPWAAEEGVVPHHQAPIHTGVFRADEDARGGQIRPPLFRIVAVSVPPRRRRVCQDLSHVLSKRLAHLHLVHALYAVQGRHVRRRDGPAKAKASAGCVKGTIQVPSPTVINFPLCQLQPERVPHEWEAQGRVLTGRGIMCRRQERLCASEEANNEKKL